MDRQTIEIMTGVANGMEMYSQRKYFREHPESYMKLVVNKPWYKQIEIMRAVLDYGIVLIRSCNDVGKTLTVAVTVFWLLDCWRPYVKVITTARNYRSLEFTLWSRIRTIYTKINHRFNFAPINLTDFKPSSKHPEWFAVGYNPEIKADEATAFQGHHAPPAPLGVESLCVFIIDEAISTHPAIFKAIEGSLFSKGTKLIAIYNPTDRKSTVAQYESDPRAKLITISQYDLFNSPEFKENPEEYSELANPTKTKEFVRIYGKDSPIVKARVLGEWVDESENVAIKYSDCKKAQERFLNYKPEHEKIEGKFKLGEIKKIVYGWDVAGEGSDLNVLRKLVCGTEGLMSTKVKQWHAKHSESMQMVYNEIIQTSGQYENTEIHLIPDAIGEGSHIPSIMGEWFSDSDNVHIVGFKAGEKASTIPERREVTILNKISEAWYRLNLLISGQEWLPIAIEMDDDTLHQLSTRKCGWALKNKEPLVYYIEEKDKWKKRNRGKSPDDADAILMSIWGYFYSQPARFEII